MTYPIFKYLTWVLIHTGTPDMIFYNCPNKGEVQAYNLLNNRYLVRVWCPNRQIDEWIDRDNLVDAPKGTGRDR